MINYKIIRELGSGAAGKVYLCKDQSSSEFFAIKEINIENRDILNRTMIEVENMKKLDHPYIVKYHTSFQADHKLYIVMEYIDGGDLMTYISERKNHYLAEDQILKIFIQIVIALKYIHSHKILHRDLKPQNIFITRVGVVKIGDFGVSKCVNNTDSLCETKVGTPYYLSPEIWNNEPYGNKTDIWSLGCILYELCALRKPFLAANLNQLLVAVFSGKVDPISQRYSQDLRDLVMSMLNQNPDLRPSADQILAMGFIKARLKNLITENENQLKTVNIIKNKKKVHRKKRLLKRKKIVMITSTTELPLPEKDLPKWAKRASSMDFNEPNYQFEENEEIEEDPDEEKDNEWDVLRKSLKVLHSLTQNIDDKNQNLALQRTI